MRIALLDGYNLMHRSRFGAKGENGIIYTFFRSLRPLLAEINPDKVYLVLEGMPAHRFQLDSEYKANRRVEPGTPKWEEMQEFKRQKKEILNLLSHLPVTLARHEGLECDDTIASLVEAHSDDECIVVSTDTDFIQLLSRPRVSLYNPVRKEYIQGVTYDYVAWKALRGDKSDNIPSVNGMTDKAAEKLLANPEKLAGFLAEGANATDYARNLELVRFKIAQLDEISLAPPQVNLEELRNKLVTLRFFSMVNDTAWANYIKTFETIYS